MSTTLLSTAPFIALLLCGASLRAESTPDAVYLDEGPWRVTDAASIAAPPASVSNIGFDANGWTPALVPGTVLASYIAAGKAVDPNFGNQQTLNSDEFYNRDFWYREDFTVPASYAGKSVLLNFDGINWKADVYVNGSRVGQINGAFIRGQFDVTSVIHVGSRNTLAVLIHSVAHPGPIKIRTLYAQEPKHNGGIMALDSPTFVASQGWNWIPTIRGRDIGIWSHVYISAAGAVRIVDPYIVTDVSPDLGQAELKVKVDLKNCSDKPVDGVLEKDASGSAAVLLDGTNAGQQITFVTPKLAPGAYDIKVGVRKLKTGAKWNLSACPASLPTRSVNIGSPQDNYSASDTPTEIDLGEWNVEKPGEQWLKFISTSRNGSGRGNSLAFDYIALTPK